MRYFGPYYFYGWVVSLLRLIMPNYKAQMQAKGWLTNAEVERIKAILYEMNPQGPEIRHVPGLKNMRVLTENGWQEIPADYAKPIEWDGKR